MLPITKKYITKNDCYNTKRTIVPKGIIVHSLGCPQPNADVIINNWNKPGVSVAVHALVETDRIIQILPWTHRSWGCGSGKNGSGNSTHIQFEICEPSGFKYGTGSTMIGYDIKKNQEYFNKVWNNAVDLCVHLCKEYNLTADDIICHAEAYQKGFASNHADVLHWFPKHGKDMDDFRQEVKSRINIPVNVAPESSKDDIKWLQNRLNLLLVGESNIPLQTDGIYGNKTRIAVLIYWEKLGWNKDGTDTGWKAGKKTVAALADGRI